MSARGFGSVLWAGAVAGAALGFYLVSLNVASERAELEEVETRIALAQRDIRLLQTEIGTRGRLAQLERWNVKFIRLSAPTADQFVEGGFQLATLVAPPKKPTIEAPVVLASVPVGEAIARQPDVAGEAAVPPTGRSASDIIHVASYTVPQQPMAPTIRTVTAPPTKSKAGAAIAKPGRPELATKAANAATADPLAPLPSAKPKPKGGEPAASSGTNSPKQNSKDSAAD